MEVPVLAVAGAEDGSTTTAHLRRLAEGVQQGRLEEWAALRHALAAEQPLRFAARVAAFLQDNP